MNLFRNIRGRIPEMLGIPDQTLPGEPIIEIYGDRRVLVEGKSAVVQYGTGCIKLKYSCGTITVSGCGLCMSELSTQQIIITGRIDCVSISRGI